MTNNAPGKLKSAIDFQVAAIKRDLAQWLHQRQGPTDSTTIRIALLETALERYLAEHTNSVSDLAAAAAGVTDLVQAVLRRAVQKRRAALQATKPTRRATAPADDEASARLLTETLKLLDALPGQVPGHLVSAEEEIDSAGEILSLLAGWFAGGIGGPPSGEANAVAGGHP
jgi:hypothetical protein